MRWPFRKQVASNKEEARRHYNAKDYKKAEPFLDAMLKENPNDAWALDVLSRLYMNTEQHHEAIPLIHRLISLNGSDDELVKRLILVGTVADNFSVVQQYAKQGHWTRTDIPLIEKLHAAFLDKQGIVDLLEDMAEQTEILYPKLLVLQHQLQLQPKSLIEEELKNLNLEAALSSVEFLILSELCDELGLEDVQQEVQVNYLTSIEHKIPEKRKFAKELIRKKRFDKALTVVQSVLHSLPEDEYSLTALTLLGSRTNQHEMVVEASRTLKNLGDLSLVVAKRFAKAAIQQGDPETVLEGMRALSSHGIDYSGTLRDAYRKCLEIGNPDALESLEDLCQTEPQHVDLSSLRYLHEGNFEQALDVVNDGLKQFPDEVLLLHRKANIFRVTGDVEGCLAVCDTILSINPDHFKASLLRTQMGTKIWDEEKLVQEYQKMIEKFPSSVKFRHQLLNYVYSGKKDFDWSLEITEEGCKHHPNDQRLLLYRALISAHLGNHDMAREIIEKALKRYPASDNALITAAQIEKELNNPEGQLMYVNKLLDQQNLSPLISLRDHSISPEFLSSNTLPSPPSTGKVSVIMTTYKRDPLLDVAINSILNQTYPDLELIVVDDRSPDDNFSYLEQRAAEEPRLRVFQMRQNGGTYLAKNFGMQQAKGDFFAFMDSDDYAHPQKIERQLETMLAHPTLQGVVHRCIRIDESSNIEFRGIGPFRMSCISLLIRKEVVEQMGYFDSLRVGADTEFIERIDAVFGKGSLLEAPELTLFMMRHPTSLTGGGPFHISWRSVAGPRLVHHTNFRMWHQQIRHQSKNGYVPIHMASRPFEVDESQKSTHYEWKEGLPLFSELIQSRHSRWWADNSEVWQKNLSAKLAGRQFVKDLGLKVPELYWSGGNVSELPEFDTFPHQFVLKPEEGWSSNNVFCMRDGEELLTHEKLSREDILSKLENDEFFMKKKPVVMVEELLEPEEKHIEDGIPRDYKFYCFGEKIVLVHVALRRSEIHKEQNEHHYFTPEFRVVNEKIMKHREQGLGEFERPDCWDEMVDAVQTIGKAVGIYMRIDMFATKRGAVFGEFTPTPHGGKGYSDYADKYLAGFWRGEEGVE